MNRLLVWHCGRCGMFNHPYEPLCASCQHSSLRVMEGNLAYLREKYATGFITHEELETGLDSVLRGGAINVPKEK